MPLSDPRNSFDQISLSAESYIGKMKQTVFRKVSIIDIFTNIGMQYKVSFEGLKCHSNFA